MYASTVPKDASGPYTSSDVAARILLDALQPGHRVEPAIEARGRRLPLRPRVGDAVEIDPLAWFALNDGTVEDLSVYDYGTTAEVVELETKMADGFTKIEVGG